MTRGSLCTHKLCKAFAGLAGIPLASSKREHIGGVGLLKATTGRPKEKTTTLIPTSLLEDLGEVALKTTMETLRMSPGTYRDQGQKSRKRSDVPTQEEEGPIEENEEPRARRIAGAKYGPDDLWGMLDSNSFVQLFFRFFFSTRSAGVFSFT